jgi:glucose-1-phosphate thymidylyltransferase
MKGVVLAGGSGSRLRPITFSMSKQLVPVANQPILFYGLQDLANAGITEVGIIISPETGDEIREAVGDGSAFGLNPTFIVQESPDGLAHALKLALPFVDGDDCLMYLGDNLVKHGVAGIVDDFNATRPNAQILLAEVPNPEAFGVAQLDAHGKVVRLEEKPEIPPSNLALVGVYLFDASVQEAVDSIRPSARGELEITDAIQYLIDSDREVRASMIKGWWKDTGKKADLLHASELVLEDLRMAVEGEVVDCRVRGEVQIGAGSKLIDCDLVGPVVIGRNVEIERSTIGPNSTIGDDCRITDAVVRHSIVMEEVELSHWRLRDSLIGKAASIGGSAPPAFVELTVGERSEITGG